MVTPLMHFRQCVAPVHLPLPFCLCLSVPLFLCPSAGVDGLLDLDVASRGSFDEPPRIRIRMTTTSGAAVSAPLKLVVRWGKRSVADGGFRAERTGRQMEQIVSIPASAAAAAAAGGAGVGAAAAGAAAGSVVPVSAAAAAAIELEFVCAEATAAAGAAAETAASSAVAEGAAPAVASAAASRAP